MDKTRLKAAVSTATTITLVVCALVITGLSVERALFEPAGSGPSEPVEVENWPSLIDSGHWRGPPDADVVILEFGDFECPACGYFANNVLKPIMDRYPRRVAHVYRHWPLEYHRMARTTAIASVCAAQQGSFDEFHDIVFADQAAIGTKPFEDLARSAGVSDLSAFSTCLESSSAAEEQIDQDVKTVNALGGTGTPTVVVNGVLFPDPPSVEAIEAFLSNSR